MNPKISVIIAAYNRAKLIPITIESFLNQTFPHDQYEILVVDNNSTDNTKDVIHEMIRNNKSGVEMRYVFEKEQGCSFAENRGVTLAKSDLVYITNDDVIADPNLLAELVKVFDIDPAITVVSGKVLPKFEEEPSKWIMKHCYNYLLSLTPIGPETLIVSSKSLGAFSNHYGIRKNVFIKLGGFQPENTAGEWVGDGEWGLNLKLDKVGGHKSAYTASSVLYHMLPKNRLNQAYVNKRLMNQGNCDSYTDYRREKYSNLGLVKQNIKYFFKIFYFLGLAIASFLIGYSKYHLYYAYTYYCVARIKYNIRLMKDENWRKFVLRSDWIPTESGFF